MSNGVHELVFTEDPNEFRDLAADHLAVDPVVTTVVSTVTDRAIDQARRGLPAPAYPRWWLAVRDSSGEVVGAAMRTAPFAPHPLFVLPMPEAAAVAIAEALHARGEPVSGVNGALPAARVVAETAAGLQGQTAIVREHTRLFELGELVDPAPVPGRLRAATDQDTDLCLRWFLAFAADAAEQAGRSHEPGEGEYFTREDMLERISQGRVRLWEVDGEPVHVTGFNAPSFGVARVGPVYTPRGHRGRGYASAGVAGVSRELLDRGARACLFTDQANPTSNRIYQALGYRAVVDMANFVIG
jgi:predicted GNAT family acetyltransferase